MLVLRIDDTDESRTVEGGEAAIVADLAWLEVGFDEGPVRQSERGSVYAEAAERAVSSGAAERDAEGALRLRGGGTTLLRPDGTATYQLASVVDDLALEITHVIRGSDHRPNLELQPPDRAGCRRRAPGGDPPRARARAGWQEALQAARALLHRRAPRGGFPAELPSVHISTSSGFRSTTCISICLG